MNASQKTDGERNREVKEINRKNERWAEGMQKGREERERGMTQYTHGNKWFFSVRQSIHLLKYCLIG